MSRRVTAYILTVMLLATATAGVARAALDLHHRQIESLP